MSKKSSPQKPSSTLIPGIEQFLDKLGVPTRDGDFDTLRNMVADALKNGTQSAMEAPPPVRWQDKLIEKMIPHGSSVLDVGCGEGDLLVRLSDTRRAKVQGIEINQEMTMRCIERGIPTYHGDLEASLRNFQNNCFDYVILEETLQTLNHPIDVLRELMRIGKKCVISFPNFAHWRVRLAFSLGGRMPKTESLPNTWYNTPNIHLCSVNDFMDWVAGDKVKILEAWSLVSGVTEKYVPEHNLTAEQALFLITK